MSASFEAVVRALWRSLGLTEPRFDEAGGVTLTIDGCAVAFSASADERSLVLSAEVGRLASDPIGEADQLRQLLRDGAALAVTKRAALRLDAGTGDDGRGRVFAEALAPCRPDSLPALKDILEDVLFLVDVHRPTLRPARGATRSGPALSPAELDGTLIFRL